MLDIDALCHLQRDRYLAMELGVEMKFPKLELDPKEMKHVVWSRPDSPSPSICSRCSGGLPEVPLMIWREDGSAISLCDTCTEKMVRAKG